MVEGVLDARSPSPRPSIAPRPAPRGARGRDRPVDRCRPHARDSSIRRSSSSALAIRRRVLDGHAVDPTTLDARDDGLADPRATDRRPLAQSLVAVGPPPSDPADTSPVHDSATMTRRRLPPAYVSHRVSASAAVAVDDRPMSDRVTRALDLAFPASCAGCGREGEPICAACRPALDARLDLAGRRADRPAGRHAGRRSSSSSGARRSRGVVRAALQSSSTAASAAGRPARARRRPTLGAGRRRRRPRSSRCRSTRDRARAARLRPGGPARRGGRARRSGCRCRAALERRRATIAQFELDRRARAANVAGAFRASLGPAPRRRSAAAGSSSSTTS